MSQVLEAVLFDVDGVLIDSLDAHLGFCSKRAQKIGLPIKMPSAEQFRERVQGGQKVSPMRDFFLAVGFPESTVDEAVADYEKNFFKEAKPKIFDGVEAMLAILKGSGVKLGLITSNVKENVEPLLAPLLAYFEADAMFFLQNGVSKAEQIKQAAKALKIDIERCVFVGDQPADEAAAKKAGCKFVGVTYGWGFAGEQYFEVAKSVFGIPMAVQRATLKFPENVQFDYAWKWFNYHADQRIKMFNYMFVGLGLFATALVGTLGKGLPIFVPAALCFLASFLAFIFSRLDQRNQYLVRLGEDVLFELEQKTIFGAGKRVKDRSGGNVASGILQRQEEDFPKEQRTPICDAWNGRHRIWLQCIALLLAATFLVAGVLLLVHGDVGKIRYGD